MKKTFFYLILITLIVVVWVSCSKEDEPADPFKPFIVLEGPNPAWSPLGEPYQDQGAKAYDITADRDTIDISFRLEVNSNVDTEKVGNYGVRFNVSDEAGNKADEVVRTVYVNIF
jgi:hypothetical protein